MRGQPQSLATPPFQITQAWFITFASANLSRGVHGWPPACWLAVSQLNSHRLSIGSFPWPWTFPGSAADTGAVGLRSVSPPLLIASSIFPAQSAAAVSTTLSGSPPLAGPPPLRLAHVIDKPALNLHLRSTSPGNWVGTHTQRFSRGTLAFLFIDKH